MSSSNKAKVEIVKLRKDDAGLPLLKGGNVTDSYYELSVRPKLEAWRIELYLKPVEKPLEKTYKGRFSEDQVEEPRVLAAIIDGKRVSWIELGYHKWKNRMRVWEFFVNGNSEEKASMQR